MTEQTNGDNRFLHRVACDELDLCDDLLCLIYESNSTEMQKKIMLKKLSKIRGTISTLTLRLDWNADQE